MNSVDDRVDLLLAAPLGCAFVILAANSGLAPTQIVSPAVSFEIAAVAANWLEIWRSTHGETVRKVLQEGRRHLSLARALLAQPDAAWWFEALDLDRQVWLQLGVERQERLPDPNDVRARAQRPPRPPAVAPSPAIIRAAGPLTQGEKYDQRPRSLLTSTLREGTSSTLTALSLSSTDWELLWDWPVSCWQLAADPSARLYTVHSPEAWHALCIRYPARGEQDPVRGLLVPDWSAIATDWDGVHLSFGGLLTSEQVRTQSLEGRSMHWGWEAEATVWLRWVFTDVTRLPDQPRTPRRLGLDPAQMVEAAWWRRDHPGS